MTGTIEVVIAETRGRTSVTEEIAREVTSGRRITSMEGRTDSITTAEEVRTDRMRDSGIIKTHNTIKINRTTDSRIKDPALMYISLDISEFWMVRPERPMERTTDAVGQLESGDAAIQRAHPNAGRTTYLANYREPE